MQKQCSEDARRNSGDAECANTAMVLVVEDEPEIARIIMAYLSSAGVRVDYAGDGRRALDLHQSLKPDLVLLDVQMPAPDGWTVLSEIRRRGQTPVIMVSARDLPRDHLTALTLGANDYIVKPFNPADLVTRVLRMLGEGAC